MLVIVNAEALVSRWTAFSELKYLSIGVEENFSLSSMNVECTSSKNEKGPVNFPCLPPTRRLLRGHVRSEYQWTNH